MKIGIFGGAFDPFHNGHLSLCRQCQSLYKFDKLLLIPTASAPHKRNSIAFVHRLSMLCAATNDIDYIMVSDIEQRLGGISYTYNTVMKLKQIYKCQGIHVIIGSDMFKIFHKWYKFSELLSEVTLVVGAREVSEYNECLEIKQRLTHLCSQAIAVDVINITVYPLSSTEIRTAVANKADVSGYINPAVYDYIKANDLYRESGV